MTANNSPALDPGQVLLQRLWQRSLAIFKQLNVSQRLYLLTALLGVVCLAGNGRAPEDFQNAAVFLSKAAMFSAVVNDLYRTWALIAQNALGKLIMTAAYFLMTMVCLGAAGVYINQVTQTDSVSLPLTRNVVAILIAPSFIGIATFFLAIAAIPLSQLYLMYSLSVEKVNNGFHPRLRETFPLPTFAMRLFALCYLAGSLSGNGIGQITLKEESLRNAMGWFAYHFEANRYTRCTLSPGQAALKGDDGIYLVITPKDDQYVFETKTCAKQ
ncbi:hypothetical protein ACMSIO_15455 [Pseudomonas benzopyrenica]|uniref:hypothetical protein n=1 Tax=Pseudomonas benzopyrenica TaxID=2993566 RepID=UPI0039C315E4